MTLNKSCYANNDERRISHAINVVNIRAISDSIAPLGEVSNALFMMLSDDFGDPYSLANFARTIRQSIVRLRQSKVLEAEIAKIDHLMQKNAQEKKKSYPQLVPNSFASFLSICVFFI